MTPEELRIVEQIAKRLVTLEKIVQELAPRIETGDFAPAAEGVTNGDSHNHNGGDGGQVDHAALASIGSNSHATIDSHIADASIHEEQSQSTWTPSITGSGSNPTVSYTQQSGIYVRIGNAVIYAFRIEINTISGGSGNLQISMPFNASTFAQGGPVLTRNVDLSGTPVGTLLQVQTSGLIAVLASVQDNADRIVEPVSALANGDVLQAAGAYITADA